MVGINPSNVRHKARKEQFCTLFVNSPLISDDVCAWWQAPGCSEEDCEVMMNADNMQIGFKIPHPNKPCTVSVWVSNGEYKSNKISIVFY